MPDYARPALEALRLERNPRPYSLLRWFRHLLWRLPPTTQVEDLRDYAKCFALSPSVFTDASLEAAVRKFEVFPAPAPLRKLLIDWGEEHQSRRGPDKYRRRSSLVLTDQERLHLRAAADAARCANGPIKHLTERHVRIVRVLALPYWQNKPPRHIELALASGTNIRTVRRALAALRTLGLLPGIGELSSLKLPENIPGFPSVMAVFAAHAGRSVKTLYRWELAASLEKPHQEE